MFLAYEHAVVAPAIEGDAFVADLAEAAKRFEVDVVVCTVGEEMLVLTGREAELTGAAIWLPPHDVDRRRASTSGASPGRGPSPACRSPPTALGDPDGACSAACDQVPGPWVVKPRFGRGSRDVYLVDEPAELGVGVPPRRPSRSCRPASRAASSPSTS